MNGEQLLQMARVYQEYEAFIVNEETAKMTLVVPFLRLLGYDPNLPREVKLEYTAEFTQGDGKRLPDRMDFAIFDRTGAKPLIVIETKPIGTDLRAKSQQLARYIAQLPDLHFGIITDGCTYLLYGDLEHSNVMDKEPFFSFSFKDPKVDWDSVATFLSKFSRDTFNAEGLLTDAENSRYRQAMIDKLVRVLRSPSNDDSFMKWLTDDIYRGKRTESVRSRMGLLAEDAVEPALLRVMGDEIIEKLKERMRSVQEAEKAETVSGSSAAPGGTKTEGSVSGAEPFKVGKKGVETTDEEMAFYEMVKSMAYRAGYNPDSVLARDTVNYFNISYDRPTKWFVRLFVHTKRQNISTRVPIERCRELLPEYEVEEAPTAFGISRIYIDDVTKIPGLEPVIIESLRALTEM